MEKHKFNLDGFVKNSDGSYSKAKTTTQPREIYINIPKTKVINNTTEAPEVVNVEWKSIKPKALRKITLNLFGEPMPKQSVRGYATGRKNAKGNLIVDHFQPAKLTDRTKDYIKQIKEQLPKDFVMFEDKVYVTKLHFIHSPLKQFHKIKGRMDAIRAGEIFYKSTRGDLDNLCKLTWDSLSGLVFKDDALIVSVDNMKKFYGVGGCIQIELAGY